MKTAVPWPLDPMLAKLSRALPDGDRWLFEPKWDGFRAIIFRDGDTLKLQSRGRKPLLRYFPELREPLLAQLPKRCVVDGELIIAGKNGLDFNTLQLRLHPAASRIDKLAAETPASIVLWDLLAEADESLLDVPLETRRARLEGLLSTAAPPLYLTPVTTDRAIAETWFHQFEGAGLDGVMAKSLDGVYVPGKRAMLKIKHERTADCVLTGFRWHKNGPGTDVGSLILGLWDDDGRLHHIGIASGFSAKLRRELAETLAPLRDNAMDGHPWASWAEGAETRQTGMQSRWSAGRDLSWEPVRVCRVVEVRYNQLTDGRLRHPAKFVRWRLDRDIESCRYDQLDVTPPFALKQILAQPGLGVG